MLRRINQALAIAAVVGVLLAAYAIYVELKLAADPQYKAACDLSHTMSCSKVLNSPYSKVYGMVTGGQGRGNVAKNHGEMDEMPVAVFGLVFYCLVIVLSQFDSKLSLKILILLVALDNITTLWMAYVLFAILEDFCVVCLGTYFVNVAIAVLTCLKTVTIYRNQHNTNQERKIKKKN